MEKISPELSSSTKKRGYETLSQLIDSIPYISFLGVVFERTDDQIKAILPFKDELIGNPSLPALHGGSIAAFLEISAIVELSWMQIRRQIEAEENVTDFLEDLGPFFLPKTIDFDKVVGFLVSGNAIKKH